MCLDFLAIGCYTDDLMQMRVEEVYPEDEEPVGYGALGKSLLYCHAIDCIDVKGHVLEMAKCDTREVAYDSEGRKRRMWGLPSHAITSIRQFVLPEWDGSRWWWSDSMGQRNLFDLCVGIRTNRASTIDQIYCSSFICTFTWVRWMERSLTPQSDGVIRTKQYTLLIFIGCVWSSL